jgi:hypothetical protein
MLPVVGLVAFDRTHGNAPSTRGLRPRRSAISAMFAVTLCTPATDFLFDFETAQHCTPIFSFLWCALLEPSPPLSPVTASQSHTKSGLKSSKPVVTSYRRRA